MGKKGSSNPMDAFRKAEKKKQLQKNKAQRKEVRENKAVWRNTKDLETEISHLKSSSNLGDEGKQRLASLESELKYVQKLKAKYVEAHPEAKDRVYHVKQPREREGGPSGSGQSQQDNVSHLYNPDGTLRDPKRSIYYDATYNPFGVPPPGTPYAERPRSEMSEDESEDESDSDDSDIVMPEGPRPGETDEDSDGSDDSDDIPLPAGPPPPRPAVRPPFRPPMPIGRPMGMGARPPRPQHVPGPAGWGHLMPGAQQPGVLPPRPPGLPVRPGSTLPPPPSTLPAKPGSAPSGTISAPPSALPTRPPADQAGPARPPAPAAVPAAAVISSEPQLRDLRKEATVFVPRAARKKAAPGGVTVNATPGAGVTDAEGDQVRVRAPARPGLMDKLGRVLGEPEKKKDETEDEYERFLAGL